MVEIRWHARGGQGAKTASDFVADAAIDAGKYSQGFPDYGPERMGAPIRAYNRISNKAVRLYCSVDHPDVVLVLDASLIQAANVTEGATKETKYIVNTPKSPEEIKKQLGLEDGNVYTVNATQISIDEIGRPIPNTPMVGALIRATDIIPIDIVFEEVKEKFSKKFSEKIVQGNINSIKRAYEEVSGV
jgi:pyruvate ferredoxin oxidoreductase gamma subunit